MVTLNCHLIQKCRFSLSNTERPLFATAESGGCRSAVEHSPRSVRLWVWFPASERRESAPHSWSRNSISRWNWEWRDEGDREGDDGANHQERIKKRKSSFKEKYDRLWKSQVKPEGVWKTGPTDNSSLEGKAATAEMILEPVTVDYAGRAWRTSIEAVIFGRLASTSPAKGGLVCSVCRCLWHKHPHQFQATSLSSLNVELWRNVPSWFLGASVSWLQLTTKCKKASNTILPLVFKEKTEPKKRKRTPS